MKQYLTILFIFLYTIVYPITYVSNASGSWTTTTIWTPNGIPGTSDDITISTGHNITYTGTLTSGVAWSAAGNITINTLGTLTITNGLVQAAGSRSRFTNNGTLNIQSGGFTQNQGAGSATIDRTVFTNNGTSTIIGDFINDQSTSLIIGTGSVTNFSNANFTIKQSSIFANSGVVNVNNTGYTKSVDFNNLNYTTDVFFNTGSKFNVTKSNVTFTGSNTFNINGEFNVSDGNITEVMSISIGTNGIITTKDTDNSGDGIFSFNNGGQTLTNNGKIYLESISSSGGGVTLVDNNLVFIHNIGIGTFDDNINNQLNVSSTGKLYYCSNPIRTTILGTVASGGKLYYSKETGSYPSSTPRDPGEIDYNVSTTDQIDMATIGYSNCNTAYNNNLSNILPIELISFNGKKYKEFIHLEWETSSEKNNDFFNILKSYDGIKFDNIAKIPGAGTSTMHHYYSYDDYEPKTGINYYKLKQTDYDGVNVDSKIISINRNDLEFNIMIYPIPSKSPDIKMIIHKNIGNVNVKCVSQNGQVIFTENINTSEKLEYDFVKYNLSSGTYFIKVESEHENYTKEIIIRN